jgi:hypothetical protein
VSEWPNLAEWEDAMQKQSCMALGLVVLCWVAVTAGASSNTLSGKWTFLVDFPPPSGSHGEPTFEFEQKGKALTATYKGPLGEYKVTGTVTDRSVVFGFDAKAQWDPSQIQRVTYTATIADSWNEMKGTVQFGEDQQRGQWVAKRTK